MGKKNGIFIGRCRFSCSERVHLVCLSIRSWNDPGLDLCKEKKWRGLIRLNCLIEHPLYSFFFIQNISCIVGILSIPRWAIPSSWRDSIHRGNVQEHPYNQQWSRSTYSRTSHSTSQNATKVNKFYSLSGAFAKRLHKILISDWP